MLHSKHSRQSPSSVQQSNRLLLLLLVISAQLLHSRPRLQKQTYGNRLGRTFYKADGFAAILGTGVLQSILLSAQTGGSLVGEESNGQRMLVWDDVERLCLLCQKTKDVKPYVENSAVTDYCITAWATSTSFV